MGAWCEGCKHRYPSGKPKTFAELKALVESGDISVMLQEDLSDGTTRLLLCDYRQPWEKEVYEVIV